MIELIKLGYEYDALEPVIDKETMEIHHSKHHNAYVTKLNDAIKGTEYENTELVDLIKGLDKLPANIKGAVQNNGGGAINHNIFFTQLVANGKGMPEGNFKNEVIKTFGSVDELISQLKAAGATRFGSGWSWLVVENGTLSVTSTANQDSPYTNGATPILGIDVWEHAYYLNYQNRRPDYLAEIFKVIDWEVISQRFDEATR